MFRMSQTQNQDGFQYRKGQEGTINMILNGGPGTYLAVLPGGYGKTLAAIGAYYELRKQRKCDRFLYIAPTAVKLMEFNKDIKSQCQKIGFEFLCKSGASVVQVNDAFAIKEHQYNKSEFFMVTAQLGINVRGPLVNDLLRKGNWFVCVDESHHYTDVNKFGNFIENLHPLYMLGLSATPNNNTQLSIFKKIATENIYEMTLAEGINEKAIRRINYIAGDYYVDLLIDGNVLNLTTEQLRDELLDNNLTETSQYEIKKNLRYLSKYVSPLFVKAMDKYDELMLNDTDRYKEDNRGKIPYRDIHQILIFADTVLSAQNYCKLINDIRPNFANWIGTGPNGRSQLDNNNILIKYKDGLIPCLVQVSVAGEGFDNPQSSIIIYLSLQHTGNQVTQKIMRGMRRNYMINDYHNDLGHIYIPTDSKALNTIKNLVNETWENIDFTGDSIIKQKKDLNEWFDLPTYEYNLFTQITDVILNSWDENILPEKDLCNLVDKLITYKGWMLDKNNLEQINELKEMISFIRKDEVIIEKEEFSRKELLSKITIMVRRLAYAIIHNSKAKFINTTVPGDIIKSIHSKYVFESKTTTKEMTFDELKNKLQWLNDLSNNINQTKILPLWLQK